MLTHWVLLGACAVACTTDLTRRRIPNVLTFALAVAAIGIHATHGTVDGLACIVTMLAVLAAGTVAFAARILGGGDVKLLAAGAGMVGYPDALPFILYTLVFGGVLALTLAALQGRAASTLRRAGALIALSSYNVSAAAVPVRGTTMPYALAITAGAVVLLLSKTVAPVLRVPL